MITGCWEGLAGDTVLGADTEGLGVREWGWGWEGISKRIELY